MKNIVLLGGSGSIGTQTLDILQQHKEEFNLLGLSVGKRVKVLEDYLQNNELAYAHVKEKKDYLRIKKLYPQTKFFYGDDGLIKMATLKKADLIFNALIGFAGLMPTVEALKAGKDVAITNKESLVAAGEIVTKIAKEHHAKLIPVDSEHSAIFQVLNGNHFEDIKRIIITASGGAFKNLTREQLETVTKADALKHPSWSMGAKITIDSASMMNKGFEIIEAHVLFDLPYEKIETLIHQESIIHSMIEYNDHTVLAQMGCADMRMPIQYALTYPNRPINNCETLDLVKLGCLSFKEMNLERFPLVKLAYEVGKKGGNLPAVLNGADETVVDLFLDDKCSFLDIERINFKVVELAEEIYVENPTLQQIIDANDWAVKKVHELLKV